MTCALTLGLVLAALAATGCATHQRTTVADRFVRQGTPSLDLGGPSLKPDTGQYIAQLRRLAAEARPHGRAASAPLVETTDPRLRERLAELRVRTSADTHRAVAAEYRRLGILDMAFRHLSAAIRLAPKAATLYDQRARIWRAWGMPRLGVADARTAVDLAPRSATAWNTLGLLLEGSQQPEEAIRAYTRAVLLDHQAAYAWNNLCAARSGQRQAAGAVHACRRAVDLDPSLWRAGLHLRAAERMAVPRHPPAATAAGDTTVALDHLVHGTESHD